MQVLVHMNAHDFNALFDEKPAAIYTVTFMDGLTRLREVELLIQHCVTELFCIATKPYQHFSLLVQARGHSFSQPRKHSISNENASSNSQRPHVPIDAEKMEYIPNSIYGDQTALRPSSREARRLRGPPAHLSNPSAMAFAPISSTNERPPVLDLSGPAGGRPVPQTNSTSATVPGTHSDFGHSSSETDSESVTTAPTRASSPEMQQRNLATHGPTTAPATGAISVPSSQSSPPGVDISLAMPKNSFRHAVLRSDTDTERVGHLPRTPEVAQLPVAREEESPAAESEVVHTGETPTTDLVTEHRQVDQESPAQVHVPGEAEESDVTEVPPSVAFHMPQLQIGLASSKPPTSLQSLGATSECPSSKPDKQDSSPITANTYSLVCICDGCICVLLWSLDGISLTAMPSCGAGSGRTCLVPIFLLIIRNST
jgi:hypothetical protein